MKITCALLNRITELLAYGPDELVGESLYTLCHGEDAAKLRKCHLDCE
jgi:neuronal PAS domain-containing protein 1/3